MNSAVLAPARSHRRAWLQALGDVAVGYFPWCFVAILALMVWNGFWHLDDTFVRDYDEGRYGVAASEMLHRHTLLVTTYAGATEFWNLKPPLGYWLLELAYWLTGESSFALRLPGVICGLITVALTMLMTRRVAGARTALLAGIFLVTSFGFMGHHGARSGELDIPLTLFVVLFLIVTPRMAEATWARCAAGVVLALGFLVKSFAILPYIVAVAVYYLLTRGAGSWRVWPLPLGIMCGITTIWAAARSVAEGSCEFVRRMFLEDLLLRSTTAIDPGPPASLWDYVGALGDRFAPWPIVVLVALALSGNFARWRLSPNFATLMWCYALVPLLLFTLARTHHSHYIIPTYPAWAILAAAATLETVDVCERVELAAMGAMLIALCVLACEVRVAVHIVRHDRTPQSQVFLTSLRALATGSRPRLQTTFTPSYSERFFLQVVDGFTLEDSSTTNSAPDPLGRRAAGRLILSKSSDSAVSSESDTVVLAQNAGYLLSQQVTPARVDTAQAGRFARSERQEKATRSSTSGMQGNTTQ